MAAAAPRFAHIGRIHPLQPWYMAPHRHGTHDELILIRRGGQTVRLAGAELLASEGDILFYPRGVEHEEWCDLGQTLESYCMSFLWPLCPPDFPQHLHDEGRRVRTLMELLLEEQDAPSPLSQGLCNALLQALVIHLERLWRYPPDNVIGRVRHFIREHLSDTLTLDRLAAEAGLSKYHFVRLYRRLTGRTPMADVRLLRLDYARQLVLTTSLPLKAIAPRAGLGDQYQMTRLFRRILDSTPGELRGSSAASRRPD